MQNTRPNTALALVGALAIVLSGCQQLDQQLPFEVDDVLGQTVAVGANGGIVSLPPDFSIEFFQGSLSGSTTVDAAVLTTNFPDDAGLVVPGTAYDIGPLGTALAVPARVQVRVAPELLAAGEDLQLALALLTQGGSVTTDVLSYDLANGLLTAEIDELGPVAAVVANDAIQVATGVPPGLGGGVIAPVGPQPSGPAATNHDGVEFSATCSADARQCFSSGIVRVWADDIVTERLGEELVLIDARVEAHLEFFNFVGSIPTMIDGYLEVEGELRARLNSVVSSRNLGDDVELFTGSPTQGPSSVTLNGSVMTIAQTSEGPNEMINFGITGIGTSDLLTIEIVGELEFENESGPPSIGEITAHVRLRR